MCTLKCGDFTAALADDKAIDDTISRCYKNDETYFVIEKTPKEYIEVIFTDNGCSVIYVRHAPEYIALDASTEPDESKNRIELMVGNEPTPMPSNMKLTKQQAREIMREFCASGKLSDSVYWLNEQEQGAKQALHKWTSVLPVCPICGRSLEGHRLGWLTQLPRSSNANVESQMDSQIESAQWEAAQAAAQGGNTQDSLQWHLLACPSGRCVILKMLCPLGRNDRQTLLGQRMLSDQEALDAAEFIHHWTRL